MDTHESEPMHEFLSDGLDSLYSQLRENVPYHLRLQITQDIIDLEMNLVNQLGTGQEG